MGSGHLRWCGLPWPRPAGGSQLRSALYRRRTQQSLAHQEQIHQRASHKQPVRILIQAVIAHFDELKLEFEYGKDVFHLGSHLGLGPVLLPFHLVDAILVAIALVGNQESSGAVPGDNLGGAVPRSGTRWNDDKTLGLVAVKRCDSRHVPL